MKLSHHDLVVLFVSIGTMLLISRVLAEAGRRIGLPVVMGELLVGILLGPTVLGWLAPSVQQSLFPSTGPASIALDSIVQLSVVFLLFVAGLEVQLPIVLRQGRLALYTSFFSLVIPFAMGFWMSWYFPEWMGYHPGPSRIVYALFMGTALAISALPVIARILMDLNLYKTRIGMLIMAAAMFSDLAGWLIFSVVLALLENRGVGTDLGLTILYIVLFGVFMLTLGRKALNRFVPFAQKKLSWPGGILAFAMGVCLLCAAFTATIGVHAILGAFIFGIALGDCVHLHERAREIIHQFITNIFAPLFFVSIGLKVDFLAHFELSSVLIILLLATVGKLVGATGGAWMGGMDLRSAMAVGFGMNARGAMEIILGTLAFQAGLITPAIFVALVVMALLTSLSSGPLIKAVLRTST